MIEIKETEMEKADKLYEDIKNIFLSKKDNPTYEYKKHQHYLYEEKYYPGISKNYYNEFGKVEFDNINGDKIYMDIHRWHAHKHNGCSGLNGLPCLEATIYTKDNNEQQILWELRVESGTLHYKATVTSLEIPRDILIEKEEVIETQPIEEKDIEPDTSKEVCNFDYDPVMAKRSSNALEHVMQGVIDKYNTTKKEKAKLLKKLSKEKNTEAMEKMLLDSAKKLEEYNEIIANAKKDISDYDSLIAKYSTFNRDLIGNAIQQLMTIIEGKDFQYEAVSHTFKTIKHGPIDSWEEDVKMRARIVVSSEKSKTHYESPSSDKSKLDELVKNGDAVILSEQYEEIGDSDEIALYTSKNRQVTCNIRFGDFDYLKNFIDELIYFKYKYAITEFTKEHINRFMQIFMQNQKERIIQNHTSRIDQKIQRFVI